jgi:ATP-dependent exoDNAse (exonuclease V) alpha subunit
MFGLKPEPIEPGKNLPKIREEIKEADIIIIDEISMCRFDVFDYVCRYIQKAQENSERKKQLIVVGDFFQLPPVIKQEEWNTLRKLWGETLQETEGFAFEAQIWKEMNFQTIILKEVIRQKGDHLFVEHLNKIRLGDCSAIEWFNQHTAVEEQKGVYLCNKNGLAKTINKQKILELNEQVVKYRGKIEGKVSDCPTEENLELCVGARVMSVVNDNGGHYQNGSLGTVEKLSETSVIVQFDNGYKKELKDYTWEYFDYHVLQDVKTGKMLLEKTVIGTFKQIPLKIAFAITVHKSQGQTYDSANFIPDCFAKGQLYVALSRVACSDALYLEQKINKKDLIVSEKVKEFYRMNGTSL